MARTRMVGCWSRLGNMRRERGEGVNHKMGKRKGSGNLI